jgi:hypothetical protein
MALLRPARVALYLLEVTRGCDKSVGCPMGAACVATQRSTDCRRAGMKDRFPTNPGCPSQEHVLVFARRQDARTGRGRPRSVRPRVSPECTRSLASVSCYHSPGREPIRAAGGDKAFRSLSLSKPPRPPPSWRGARRARAALPHGTRLGVGSLAVEARPGGRSR